MQKLGLSNQIWQQRFAQCLGRCAFLLTIRVATNTPKENAQEVVVIIHRVHRYKPPILPRLTKWWVKTGCEWVLFTLLEEQKLSFCTKWKHKRWKGVWAPHNENMHQQNWDTQKYWTYFQRWNQAEILGHIALKMWFFGLKQVQANHVSITYWGFYTLARKTEWSAKLGVTIRMLDS